MAKEAVNRAYNGHVPDGGWEKRGIVEFDAVHMVALDADGEEIEETARGKG